MEEKTEIFNSLEYLIENGIITWDDIFAEKSAEEKDKILNFAIENNYIDYNTWQKINKILRGNNLSDNSSADLDNANDLQNLREAIEKLKSDSAPKRK